jgi:hypothetical protein
MKRLLPLICLVFLSCAPRDDTPPDATPDNGAKPTVLIAPPKVPDALTPRINEAIANVRNRDLRTTNAFWTVFHGILGLGPDVTLLDDATGERVNALDRICTGTGIRGLKFIPTPDGLDVETQPGTGVGQGHQDQFVAEMVQWGVSPNRLVTVGERHFTFADFFRHSKARASVTRGQELSWAIVIVAEHFGTDHQWTNAFGEPLRFEDVMRYELNQPIDTGVPPPSRKRRPGHRRLEGRRRTYRALQEEGPRIPAPRRLLLDGLRQQGGESARVGGPHCRHRTRVRMARSGIDRRRAARAVDAGRGQRPVGHDTGESEQPARRRRAVSCSSRPVHLPRAHVWHRGTAGFDDSAGAEVDIKNDPEKDASDHEHATSH